MLFADADSDESESDDDVTTTSPPNKTSHDVPAKQEASIAQVAPPVTAAKRTDAQLNTQSTDAATAARTSHRLARVTSHSSMSSSDEYESRSSSVDDVMDTKWQEYEREQYERFMNNHVSGDVSATGDVTAVGDITAAGTGQGRLVATKRDAVTAQQVSRVDVTTAARGVTVTKADVPAAAHGRKSCVHFRFLNYKAVCLYMKEIASLTRHRLARVLATYM